MNWFRTALTLRKDAALGATRSPGGVITIPYPYTGATPSKIAGDKWRNLSDLTRPSDGLLQVGLSHDATYGVAEESPEHRCYPRTTGASTRTTRSMIIRWASGGYRVASTACTSEGDQGQARSELEVVGDYSEKPGDNTTTGSPREPSYRPRVRQRSMSPMQGGRKAEQEISNVESSAEYFNEKQRKGVALVENRRHSEAAAAVEAT